MRIGKIKIRNSENMINDKEENNPIINADIFKWKKKDKWKDKKGSSYLMATMNLLIYLF